MNEPKRRGRISRILRGTAEVLCLLLVFATVTVVCYVLG